MGVGSGKARSQVRLFSEYVKTRIDIGYHRGIYFEVIVYAKSDDVARKRKGEVLQYAGVIDCKGVKDEVVNELAKQISMTHGGCKKGYEVFISRNAKDGFSVFNITLTGDDEGIAKRNCIKLCQKAIDRLKILENSHIIYDDDSDELNDRFNIIQADITEFLRCDIKNNQDNKKDNCDLKTIKAKYANELINLAKRLASE